MRTIILAAGRSERFAAAGFAKPKPLLPMPDGRTLLEWQVDALGVLNGRLVINERDRKAMAATVTKVGVRGVMDYFFVIPIIGETKGPLHTLWSVRSWLEYPEPLLIVYCDVLPMDQLTDENKSSRFVGELIVENLDDTDARIVEWPSENDRFTAASRPGWKESGIFWFRNGAAAVANMRWKPRGEINGLPDLVKAHEKWDWFSVDEDHIADLGIPRDYRNWMAEQGCPLDENWRPINAPS